MKIWPAAIFHTSLPDDFIERSEEDIQNGGLFIATEIANALNKLEYKTSNVEEYTGHGWIFEVKAQKATFDVFITQLKTEVYLWVTDRNFPLKYFTSHKKLLGNLLLDINRVLQCDERFHDILWWLSKWQVGPSSETPYLP